MSPFTDARCLTYEKIKKSFNYKSHLINMEALISIFVCVVLPVSIVLIIFIASMNSDNKRAKVLIKAIENNNSVDAGKLAEALAKPRKSPRELLTLRLLRGCMFTLAGIGLITFSVLAFANGCEIYADQVTVPGMFGAISLAIGISYLVVYLVTRKHIQ